ncbi:MAG: tetratricopeptide repeat protein [Fimbriimonadaceae bacterium]|nr:tetratricopeptide repeat protein [Fimbriimonadaceae bacterium]QYK55144.1 MAG: tetratricopeptide repeat protein [Fimbriimonadaceae bacterium]
MQASFAVIHDLFEPQEPQVAAEGRKTGADAAESSRLGEQAILAGDYEAAIAHFRNAVEQSSEKNPWALMQLGNAYSEADLIPQAFRQYQKAKRIQKSGELMVAIASLYQRFGGKAKDALEALRQAVELEPENPFPHHKLAEALRHYGFRTDALTAARVAVACAPDQAFYHYWLGELLLEMRRFGESVESLHAAIELSPGEANLFFLAGQALWGAGRSAEAIRAIRLSCDIEPDFAAYRIVLERFLRQSGFASEAEREAKAVENAAPFDREIARKALQRFSLA